MPRKPKSIAADWHAVFTLANHFSQSAGLLAQATNRTLQYAQGPVVLPHFIPAIVCRALTVELLLKSLILLEKGDALQIHPLTDLYALLSVESKAAVENNFNAKAASSRILQAMKGKFPEISLNFHDVLAAVTRAFEKWRYAFDDSDLGGAHGLFELEAAIRERIATLAPNAA